MELLIFSIFLFYIIISPGIIFLHSYFSGEFSEKHHNLNKIDFIVISAVYSIVLHFILNSFIFDIDFLMYLFDIKNNPLHFAKYIESNFIAFSSYLIFMWVASFFVAMFVRALVINFNLDLVFPFLRLSNNWYYVFSERAYKFENKIKDDKNYSLALDIHINVNDHQHIISGILDDYHLNKEGISNIILRDAINHFYKDKERSTGIMLIPFKNDYIISYKWIPTDKIDIWIKDRLEERS